MENVAEKLSSGSDINSLKDQPSQAAAPEKSFGTRAREVSGKGLALVGSVTTTVVITTAAVYVGMVALSAMNVGVIAGLLIMGAGALACQYLSEGLLSRTWNPIEQLRK